MRPTRAFAALALLPLALASCGSGQSSSNGTTAATGGTSATASETSKGADSVYALCDKAGPIDKNTYYDTAKKAGEETKTFHMELGSQQAGATTTATGAAGLSGSGDVDVNDSANPKMRLTLQAGQSVGAIDMIVLGKDVYMKLASLAGGKYMKTDASQLGMNLDSLRDPAAQTEKSKDAVSGITCVGREDVAGTKTAHVRLTVDPAKAAAAAGQTAPATASASLPSSIDTDAWYDEKGRPVKTSTNVGSGYLTMTFSKWGEPVSVTAPPAASVTTMPSAASSAATPAATPTAG